MSIWETPGTNRLPVFCVARHMSRHVVVVPRRVVAHLGPRASLCDNRLAEEIANWTPTSGSDSEGGDGATSGGEAMVSPPLVSHVAARRAPTLAPTTFAKEALTASVAQSALHSVLGQESTTDVPRPTRRRSALEHECATGVPRTRRRSVGTAAVSDAGRVWHSTQVVSGTSVRDVVRGVVRLCNLMAGSFNLMTAIAAPADMSTRESQPPPSEALNRLHFVSSTDSLDAMQSEDAIAAAAAAARPGVAPLQLMFGSMRDGLQASSPHISRDMPTTPRNELDILDGSSATVLTPNVDAAPHASDFGTGSRQPQLPLAADAAMFDLCPVDEDLALSWPDSLEEAGETHLELRFRAAIHAERCARAAAAGEAAPQRTVLEVRVDAKPAVRDPDGVLRRRKMLVIRFRRPRQRNAGDCSDATREFESGTDSSCGPRGDGREGGGGAVQSSAIPPTSRWDASEKSAHAFDAAYAARRRRHTLSRGGDATKPATSADYADSSSSEEPSFASWLEDYEREIAAVERKSAGEPASPIFIGQAAAEAPRTPTATAVGLTHMDSAIDTPAPPAESPQLVHNAVVACVAAAPSGRATRGGGWLKRLQVRFATPVSRRRRSQEGGLGYGTTAHSASVAPSSDDVQYDGDAEGGTHAGARRTSQAPPFIRTLMMSPTPFRSTRTATSMNAKPGAALVAANSTVLREQSNVNSFVVDGACSDTTRYSSPMPTVESSAQAPSNAATSSAGVMSAFTDASMSVTNSVRRMLEGMRISHEVLSATALPTGAVNDASVVASTQRASIFGAFATPLFHRRGGAQRDVVQGAGVP